MRKLTTRDACRIESMLLTIDAVLTRNQDTSDDGEIGIDGDRMDTIAALLQAVTEKLESARWL